MFGRRKQELEERLALIEARQQSEAAAAMTESEIIRALKEALANGTTRFPRLSFDMWRDDETNWKIHVRDAASYFTIATIPVTLGEIEFHD